jgi:AbrB family looped-hinge helix DNA binding protein
MALTKRVRMSSKGQVVIPQEMRERLGIGEGDELILHLVSDRLLVAEPATPSEFETAMARLQAEARERGITREDVEKALAEVRQEVYSEWVERRKPHTTAS